MTSEQAKAKGLYHLAGELAYVEGSPCIYGAHYGLRSGRDNAAQSFAKGWHAVREECDTAHAVWEA